MVPLVLLFKNQKKGREEGGVFAKQGIPPSAMVPDISDEKDHTIQEAADKWLANTRAPVRDLRSPLPVPLVHFQSP